MKINRRALLGTVGTLALPAVFGSRAWAQKAEFNYKFANNLPSSHPMNLRAKEMADAIRKDTQGRVNIELFPNNQLGSDTDMLSQVRAGGIEFFTMTGLLLSTLVPKASIPSVGFAFKDYDAVWKAVDGALGAFVRAEILKSNLVPMEKVWDNGFRQITTSTKAIVTPADLQGLKIRVPPSPMYISLFKTLGAAPTSINFSETYSALQTKVVEGQENPLAVISTAKLYEVQKFCSQTSHMWDGYWFLANKRAWERLPQDLRTIVSGHVNAAALKERVDVAALNTNLQKELEARGMAFNAAKIDLFREHLRKANFYGEWKGRYGDEAWALLESASGKLL